jgi:hypothetical protein
MGRRRARTRRRARRPLAPRRLTAQLPDSIDCDRIETGEIACLDIKAPVLNPLQQLRTLQTQLFGQLVNSRRQRQLLPDQIPVLRISHDPGTLAMVQTNLSWVIPPEVVFWWTGVRCTIFGRRNPAIPLVCTAGPTIASRSDRRDRPIHSRLTKQPGPEGWLTHARQAGPLVMNRPRTGRRRVP